MAEERTGRQKGTPNKNKRGLAGRLRAQYGEDFDVIMMLGKECKNLADISHIEAQRRAKATEARHEAHSNEDLSTEDLGVFITNEHKAIVASTAASLATIGGAEKLAQWIEPKLKQVEVKLDVDSTVNFNFDLGDRFANNAVDAIEAIQDAVADA